MIPNAPRIAAAENETARPVDPERHNQQVIDDFVGAGISGGHVAGVDELTLLAAHSETRSPLAPEVQVIRYRSALKRAVSGVPVAKSVA
jgi:hypothetical protein